MDKQEAEVVLMQKLLPYVARGYEKLQVLIETQETFEVVGPSGQEYQVEILACWDDKPGGVLRLIGCIDDGGLTAYFPLSDSILIAPDGTTPQL
jgi:hypothetical protein